MVNSAKYWFQPIFGRELLTKSNELNSLVRLPIDFCCCCDAWPFVTFGDCVPCIDRDESFFVTELAWLLLGELTSAEVVIASADNCRRQFGLLQVEWKDKNMIVCVFGFVSPTRWIKIDGNLMLPRRVCCSC